MRTTLIVVAREYLQRVRTKGFVIGTVAGPILLLAIVVIPGVLGARGALAERHIGLIDRTGVLAETLVPRLEAAGWRVEPASPGGEVALRARAEAGDLHGVLEVGEETLRTGRAIWWGKEAPSTLRRTLLEQALGRSALERRLGDRDDPEVAALLDGGGLEIRTVGDDPRDALDRAAGVAAGFVGAFFLYVVLVLYGSMVLRSVLEEKTGRIVEVVLSSLQPWQLMLGKVLGVGAVGLTQLLAWVLAGLMIVGLGVPALIPFMADVDVLERVPELVPDVGVVVFFLVSFLLGYFIYASLFAAVGAMCSSEQEAQQLQLPVVMLILVPIVLLMPVLEFPDATWARWASLFPFFAPILMFGRVAVGAAPLWEVLLSVVGMVLALLAVAWIAGRIYRAGILMQGKRPTVPELWRWVRAP
jgi:ABC-2 type transport system permease protein